MATQDLTIRESVSPVRVIAPAVAIVVAGAIGFLAVQSPLAALALGGGILLAVAIVVSPDVATLAVVAILYSNAAAVAVKSHGFPAAGPGSDSSIHSANGDSDAPPIINRCVGPHIVTSTPYECQT